VNEMVNIAKRKTLKKLNKQWSNFNGDNVGARNEVYLVIV